MAFVGYGRGNQDGQAELELTFNYGVEQYALGTAYGHIAIAVSDVAGTCERIRALGGTITILGADGATLAELPAPAGFSLAVSPTGRQRGTLTWPAFEAPGTEPVAAGTALLSAPSTRR